ncbi:MAG: NAD-dependent epimerase/dehydratase family protein [Candidatus Aminicenantes bacterium]|nr:MAG: NAD-dependent epimerase/dehydratase family protein [Candidatus Aminicenantes bacterium]
MKILIIGGTRFLGYHIAKRLLADGHDLTLFNRGKTIDDLGEKVRRIHGDRYNSKAFSERLSGEKFDAVVDMIAFKTEDSQTAVETFMGNVGHFIHISTAAVYIVTQDFPCPIREEDFNRPLYSKPEANDGWWSYGFHKRECENVLREAFERHGFPVTMFRLPIVMGERDYSLRAYSYFLRILDGKPLILPDGGLNVSTHIYQDDIARTISSNLLNPSSLGQAFNLAQPEILTLRTFVLKSSEIMNKKIEIVEIPSAILEKAGLGISFSPFSMRRPFVLDIQKARRELSFSATPFDIWVGKTIRWFVEDYDGEPPENYNSREKENEIVKKYKQSVETLTARNNSG